MPAVALGEVKKMFNFFMKKETTALLNGNKLNGRWAADCAEKIAAYLIWLRKHLYIWWTTQKLSKNFFLFPSKQL